MNNSGHEGSTRFEINFPKSDFGEDFARILFNIIRQDAEEKLKSSKTNFPMDEEKQNGIVAQGKQNAVQALMNMSNDIDPETANEFVESSFDVFMKINKNSTSEDMHRFYTYLSTRESSTNIIPAPNSTLCVRSGRHLTSGSIADHPAEWYNYFVYLESIIEDMKIHEEHVRQIFLCFFEGIGIKYKERITDPTANNVRCLKKGDRIIWKSGEISEVSRIYTENINHEPSVCFIVSDVNTKDEFRIPASEADIFLKEIAEIHKN